MANLTEKNNVNPTEADCLLSKWLPGISLYLPRHLSMDASRHFDNRQSASALKHNIGLIIFFSIITIPLLAPIASNTFLPDFPDFLNYIGTIVQAKLALVEGQFPIRVAPWQFSGWRYPLFQFYSPLAFSIAGIIYAWITPANPFLAFKIVMWLALVFGGYYAYHFAYEFVSSKIAALLAAVIYVTAPFFILNINVSGDLPQTLAMGLLPWLVYYNYRCQKTPSIKYSLISALGWFALITVHLPTFVYASLFIGIFLVIINIQYRIPLRNLMWMGMIFFYGCLLSLWFLAPVFLMEPYLFIKRSLINPFIYHWLSPLSTLFSPHPIFPTPLSNNALGTYAVALGWPVLLSVGFVAYRCWFRSEEKKPAFLTPLFYLFLILIFLIWSPINIWIFFPKFFFIAQFSARLIIQAMWISIPLVAWTISELFQGKLHEKHVLTGLLLIGLSSGSWLANNHVATETVNDIIRHPDAARSPAKYNYLINSPSFKTIITNNNPIKTCQLNKTTTVCQITSRSDQLITLPILYYPDLLKVHVDGKSTAYQPVAYQSSLNNTLPEKTYLVGLNLPEGKHTVQVAFQGLWWANILSEIAWGWWVFMLIFKLTVSLLRIRSYLILYPL